MKELLDLVVAAGHVDFRDARGPLQFTQRQAAGKFTRDEADAFIARLRAEAEADEAEAGEVPGRAPNIPVPRVAPSRARRTQASPRAVSLEGVPSDVLAAELQSRGWVVLEP